MLALVLQLVAIFSLIYFYIHRKYSYWSNRGIDGPRPIFPFGYLAIRAVKQPNDFELDLARKYGRVYGVYSGLLPTLTVSDAELIKTILIKDFTSFLNRRSLNSYHQLWNGNLFNAEGDAWKRVRTITSPAFTLANLRRMFPLMNRCVDKLTHYLDVETERISEIEIDTKRVIIGFTIDVIASTSFATETDTNGDRSNQKDPMFVNSQKIYEFNGFRVAAVYALPRIVLNALNIRTWFDDDAFQYFINLTRKILHQRKLEEGSDIKRNDFVQLMVDSYVFDEDLNDKDYNKLTASATGAIKNEQTEESSHETSSKKHSLSENEIIAQSILFFAAGFETTASTLTSCLFELSKNPEVQERLHAELDQNLEEFRLDVPIHSPEYYDKVLNQSPYLDAVIKETLRKYPPVTRLERRVTSEDGFKLDSVHLEKDTLIEISIYSVHHDEQYYPEPAAFKPERFLPEHKHLLTPYTYLPFGLGPRNCIGMRFAYQEIKLCLAKIIRRYRFSTSPQTPVKLTFKPGSLLLNVKPFPLKVSRR